MNNVIETENVKNNNELIDEILKIDEIAQKRIEQEQLTKNINLKKIDLKKKQALELMEQESEFAMEKLQKFKLKNFEEKISTLEQESKQKNENLERIFKIEQNQWTQNITEKVLENFKNFNF